MGTFWQDLQFAARMMRKNLGFTAAAVICLMLGIGATTGIFTVVNAVLLRPLPYAHPEQLIRVYTEFPTFPNGGLPRFWSSGPEFLDLRRDTHSFCFARYLANRRREHGRQDATRSRHRNAAQRRPAEFARRQSRHGPPDRQLRRRSRRTASRQHFLRYVAQRLRRRSQYRRPRNATRRQEVHHHRRHAARFPVSSGRRDSSQIWFPLQLDPANPGGRSSHNYYMLARTKPGVSPAQAQGELQALVQSYGEHRAPKTHSFDPKNHTLVSFPLQAEVVSSVRPALLMLLGAVAFVLLIASVNVPRISCSLARKRVVARSPSAGQWARDSPVWPANSSPKESCLRFAEPPSDSHSRTGAFASCNSRTPAEFRAPTRSLWTHAF